jgi:hypothetical protein
MVTRELHKHQSCRSSSAPVLLLLLLLLLCFAALPAFYHHLADYTFSMMTT